MRTCLILPTYNEDKMIVSVIRSARRVIPDVVVVDDGSTDQTAERVRLLLQKDKSTVTLLQHKHNLGKGMALRTGFAYALSNGHFRYSFEAPFQICSRLRLYHGVDLVQYRVGVATPAPKLGRFGPI